MVKSYQFYKSNPAANSTVYPYKANKTSCKNVTGHTTVPKITNYTVLPPKNPELI